MYTYVCVCVRVCMYVSNVSMKRTKNRKIKNK